MVWMEIVIIGEIGADGSHIRIEDSQVCEQASGGR
jgi:hypothetical protein